MTRRPCVLVTGVGGRSVGHQILHALQLTGDRYRIVCCDADSFSFGLYQVPGRYLVPPALAPSYVEAILEIIRREAVDALLPGTEAEIRTLVQAEASLAEAGCRLVASPAEVIELCGDKGHLYRWLAEQGIGVPRSAGVADLEDFLADVGFPIVAKPAGSSGGSRNVMILSDRAEIDDYIQHFPGPEADIVFQEYVGSPETEYTVGVVVSHAGEIIDSIVLHRKLFGLSLGITRVVARVPYALSTGYSQGFIVRHPAIQDFCESLALRMGMRGPVNIQLRLQGDEVRVFEVHPRFSGTTSIRADAGLNEPDLVLRDLLLGESPGRQPYRYDVAAIRAFQTILVPVKDMASVERLPSGKA